MTTYMDNSLLDSVLLCDQGLMDLKSAAQLAYGFSIPMGKPLPLGMESDFVGMFQDGWLPNDIGSGNYTYGHLARCMLAYRTHKLEK